MTQLLNNNMQLSTKPLKSLPRCSIGTINESTGKYKISESESHPVMYDSLQSHGLQPTRLLCLWDSPCQDTGVGSLSRLQWIFRTQGSNPGLLHCRQILYHLSHREAHKISEMVINAIIDKARWIGGLIPGGLMLLSLCNFPLIPICNFICFYFT